MSEEQKSVAQGSASGSSSSSSGRDPAQAVPKPNRQFGRKLTAKQQQIADLKDAGKNNIEIGQILGVSHKFVGKVWTVINHKRGKKLTGNEDRGVEFKSPEVAAAAIEAAADPLSKSQREAIDLANAGLQASGIPGKVTAAIVRRMMVRYANAVTVKKEITTQEMLKAIDQNIYLIDSYIDDKVVAEANLRDLALAKTALIEKRQLLRGEPTQIISNEDRKKLHELFPALIEEAKRRGVTVDGQVVSKEVSVESR